MGGIKKSMARRLREVLPLYCPQVRSHLKYWELLERVQGKLQRCQEAWSISEEKRQRALELLSQEKSIPRGDLIQCSSKN